MKLRALKEVAKKLKAEIGLGEKPPLTLSQNGFLAGRILQYDQYKGTTEFDLADQAVMEAIEATKVGSVF